MNITLTNNGSNAVTYDLIDEKFVQPGETVTLDVGGKLELREMGLTVEPALFKEENNVGGD